MTKEQLDDLTRSLPPATPLVMPDGRPITTANYMQTEHGYVLVLGDPDEEEDE